MKNRKPRFEQRLRRYQRQRFVNLNHYLDKYASAGRYKTLHALRLEIKKITAIVHLIEYCRQTPLNPLNLKHLDKIFHLAGKVRSHNIDKKLVRQFGGKLLPLHTGKKAAKAAKRKLRDKYKNYKTQMEKLNEECIVQLRIINAQNLNSYLQTRINFAHAYQPGVTTGNLHGLRKCIKEIIYLYPLQDASAAPKIKKMQAAYLEQLQDAIGKWHDIDKFINGIQTAGKDGGKLKIPASLISERKRRLAAAEKEISVGAVKKWL